MPEKPHRTWICGGILDGLIFLTFYYPFFIGALLLTGRTLRLPFTNTQKLKQLVELRHAAAVCVASAIVAAPYWGPLLLDLITIGTDPMQNRWFTPSMAKIPLSANVSLTGLIGLFGAGYLLLFPHEQRLGKEFALNLLVGLAILGSSQTHFGLIEEPLVASAKRAPNKTGPQSNAKQGPRRESVFMLHSVKLSCV